MPRQIHILSVILLVMTFTLHLSSLEAGEMEDALKKLQTGEQKIDFYGIAIDQHGKPVEGAKATFHASAYGILRPKYTRLAAVSGADGRFEIHAGKGARLDLENMECHGYEFPREGNTRGFTYDLAYVERHRPDKANPVVFHLRKKHSEAVVLLNSRASILLSTPKNISWFGWDVASCREWTAPAPPDPGYFRDYEVTGEHDAEKKEWTLTIKMNGEQAGVLMSDKLLYEAPADGYAKEVTLTFKYSDKPPLKHLYLRLRDCGMYARLDVEHGSVSEKGVYFSCKTVINPYGSRSLEDLVYVGSDESDELILKCFKEARKAMKEQRFAPRPPFEQWIREGKVKY